MKSAAAQLSIMLTEGQSTLKRTTDLIDKVQTCLEQRNSASEQCSYNDKNTTTPQYGPAEYKALARLVAKYGYVGQVEGLHPLVQHQPDNLAPLDLAHSVLPYLEPYSYGSANEQPMIQEYMRRLNGASTSCSAADEQMISCQHTHHPNDSGLANIIPDNRCDNKRRGHIHGHRSSHDRLPLISNFKTGSSSDTYHGPQDPHSQRGLYRGLDTGHYDVESLGPQRTHGLEARLDNINDNNLAMPSDPRHPDLERADVRTPWHRPTDYPISDGPKDHQIGKDLYEAQSRQTPETRSTSHRAPLNFNGPMDDPTAADIDYWRSWVQSDADKRRLEQWQAQLRQSNVSGVLKRKAVKNPGPPCVPSNVFNDDLEQPLHHRYDVPFRPNKESTTRVCTARKDGFDYPALPEQGLQQLDVLKRPLVAAATSTVPAKATTEDTFHGQQHGQGPVVDAKRSYPAHNDAGVRTIIDPSKNDENPIIPSRPSIHSSESSRRGCDTPDIEDGSSAEHEDKDDAKVWGWLGM